MTALLSVLDASDVIVCCGPGGVGKTTVSATLALAAAQRGSRVCVLTVDPARRLAQALGISDTGHAPSHVAGITPGSLDAVMLDPEQTFDELIDRYAESEEQSASIKSNRLYRNLASAMSGTLEYMAMEKLYELISSGAYDLVVVDTPPTRNALDLLDAPRRLTSFLENRIFRALLAPTKAYLRAVSFATRALLSTIGRVAGAELVSDAVTFFQAFAGMEEGFAERANAVHERLRAEGTTFLLVTSPRPDAISEASFFADRLEETGLHAGGIVVNRIHPRFITGEIPEPPDESGVALRALWANLSDLDQVASDERDALRGLIETVAPAPVASLPLSDEEIHDLDGLIHLGGLLIDEASGPTAS